MPEETPQRRGLLASIGPAIIVAAIVLGPGSILTSSKVGCAFGYELLWVVVLAAVLMIGMTAISARVGVSIAQTPCAAIAATFGRPVAVAVGLVLFLVVAGFQFSNNIAIVAALEPYFGEGRSWRIALLVALNAGILTVLFVSRRLYRPIENTMKVLVGCMALGFLGNVVLSEPSLVSILRGLWPGLPEALSGSLLPRLEFDHPDPFMPTVGHMVDPLGPVQGLIATTFSVAGAFYTAYLVKQKGWGPADLRRGLVDSVVGIGVLAILTMTIMVTAAAVLHGEVDPAKLTSAVEVGQQLEPAFGAWASILFSVGLLAGGLSSFLVNVMIGGTVFADGLGQGGDMDAPGPKNMTALAMGVGLVVALLSLDSKPVALIVFAQSMTVLGNPVLALALLWLGARANVPKWLLGVGVVGFLLVLFLALRTGMRLWLG